MSRCTMLRIACACVLAMAFAPATIAQSKPEGPLTRSELGASLAKVEQLLFQALNLAAPKASSRMVAGTGAASRADAVAGLYRLHLLSKPAHSYVPVPAKFDAARVKRLADRDRQRELLDLLRWGYLAPVGSISAGPVETLTIPDWGDALGYFLSRVAELTHTPSAKFSPWLMSDGGLSNVKRNPKP